MHHDSFNFALRVCACVIMSVLAAASYAQEERTHTAEQLEALAQTGELDDTATSTRPAKLPDLTRGQPIGDKEKTDTWNLGPTGILGYMVGGLKGDQIEVQSVFSGSPAEGKLQWGDVILGVNGQTFKAGENMGLILGNAIIESEKEENKGVLVLKVWRDANFLKRNGKKDITGADVDELIGKAVDDVTLYDWMSKDDQAKENRSSDFKEFPLAGQVMDVELTLEVLPPYSDTSPYDCPKTARILENAWKVLAQQLETGMSKRIGRGGSVQALALVASGKPEYIELVKNWLRSPGCKTWQPPKDEIDTLRLPSKSWNMSFDGLDCALYYDATGDDYVLPALKYYAVLTAMGQDGGGTWGHNWAQPTFNGGKLHGMNPGYGALNASGNRCFFLIALAQKLGIKDPEVDAAVERSRRFFRTYVDRGGIPYGQHPAADTDDSNGKNTGIAFALLTLGDKYGAKYFAQMSTHASFTRRGGHGNDYFWHWSPWAASLCGPRGIIAAHRNLRWRFTLCRRFDGGFVIQSPTGGIQSLRDPTATYALHYSVPLKQTLITGKDADESLWWTDHEFEQLMASARGQLSDPVLLEQAGTPWPQRSTDELFTLLNIFKPKARRQFATELGKRYAAGEKDILPRLAELLNSDDARFRDAACIGLTACGADATLQYMSGIAKLLSDEHEFVRANAAKAMAQASNSPQTQVAILQAIVNDTETDAMSPNVFSTVVQGALFRDDSKLATTPFEAGLDDDLVWQAMEKIITLDPASGRPLMSKQNTVWSGDTVVRLSGPIVYTAEEEQIADQMFSARRSWSLSLLQRLGYQECIEAAAHYLGKREAIPRTIRSKVFFKRGNVEADPMLKYPAASVAYLPALKRWLLDDPLAIAKQEKYEPIIPLYQLIDILQAVNQPQPLPRLSEQVEQFFQSELDEAGTLQAKVDLCRQALADPARKDYFRMMAAMTRLVEHLGDDAVPDLMPYIGHEYWRLREHARHLAKPMASGSAEAKLVEAFDAADARTAQAILEVLTEAGASSARNLAERALKHDAASVRGSAIKALSTIDGGKALPWVFDVLKTASSNEEWEACEAVLVSRLEDEAWTRQASSQAVQMLPSSTRPLRDSLYWIIGQLGGSEGLAVLRQQADTRDENEFRVIVNALSYSGDPEAEKVLLDIIRANAKSGRADIAASEGVRRMVIGEEGLASRPISSQLDYAEAVLNTVLNHGTISYLGRIRTGRCAFILQKAMRAGAPGAAAEAIIVATSDLAGAPEADRKLAESALIDAIEFIEVTYLRGGATEQDWRTYPKWKAISAEAGKNLLKIAKPGKAPLPEFNDTDLDL